jgi:hypothetical protein
MPTVTAAARPDLASAFGLQAIVESGSEGHRQT